MVAWTSEKGSQDFVYASTQNNRPGIYISACKEVPVSTFAVSAKGRETPAKYWKVAVDVLRGFAPEVDEVLKYCVNVRFSIRSWYDRTDRFCIDDL
jgi:hypothetical protein